MQVHALQFRPKVSLITPFFYLAWKIIAKSVQDFFIHVIFVCLIYLTGLYMIFSK